MRIASVVLEHDSLMHARQASTFELEFLIVALALLLCPVLSLTK